MNQFPSCTQWNKHRPDQLIKASQPYAYYTVTHEKIHVLIHTHFDKKKKFHQNKISVFSVHSLVYVHMQERVENL